MTRIAEVSTPGESIVITEATPADAADVSAFARRVFEDTFGPHNTAQDMQLYADVAFTPERQLGEISSDDHTCLIATLNDAIVAYALLAMPRRAADVSAGIVVEIERFYVDHALHGRGLAPQLMEHCKTLARRYGSAGLWLGVWQPNARAVRFYQRNGFRIVGEQTFLLGSDLQNDYVMECVLD